MKTKFKLFIGIFAFALISFFGSMTSASATVFQDVSDDPHSPNLIRYHLSELRRTGDYLHLSGFAYVFRFQNYNDWNHAYYVKVKGSDGSVKSYSASKFQQSENLNVFIGGLDYMCPDYADRAYVTCNRTINYAGWYIDIPIADFKPDINYSFYIQVEEYQNGTRGFESKIVAPEKYVSQFEWNHSTYQINTSFDTSQVYIDTTGVTIRKNPDGSAGKYERGEWPFGSNFQNAKPYWGMGYFYHFYQIDESAGGVNYNLGFNAGHIEMSPFAALTVQVAVDGTQASGWIPSQYCMIFGEPLTIITHKKSYINNLSIETKTAKVGTNATIKANVNNLLASGQNPAIVNIYLDNSLVYTSGTQNWGGVKSFSVNVPAVSYNRTAKVVVTETTNGKTNEISTTLYAASNQTNTVTAVSGTIKGNNPIYVIKNGSGETKYYETITYNQGATSYSLDDSNTLSRSVTLSYSTNYSGISSWDASSISGTNYISSPASTYNLTKSSSSGTSVTLKADKAVTYSDLNNKSMTTTVSGVGVNNIVIKMNASYKFVDASDIKLIDTRTHKKNTASEVYVTLNNSKNRKVRYQIYYKSTLLIDKTETWNGDKKITLNPTIPSDDYIKVIITQPNTISESLSGQIVTATNDVVDINKSGSYTSPTPVRITTTKTEVKKFYETITITSLDANPTIKAGEGFQNRIKIQYSTTENVYDLTCADVSSSTSFSEKDSTLSYDKQADGTYLVQQSKTCTSSKVVDTTLPAVVIDKKTGDIYTKGKQPAGAEVLEGGNKWYVSMDAVEGNYEYQTTVKGVGKNSITFVISNSYTVSGSLLGNTDSKYKIIRVKNPTNPNFTWHKTYTMADLVSQFGD